MSFDAQLRTTLESIHARPSAAEAAAIIDVARLAASADNRTDLSETVVLLSLTRIVGEMAGLTTIAEPTALDASRVLEIGEQLVPQGARELAFACAFLVMIQDLELTEAESRMADALGEALVIEPARAKELASTMEALVRGARRA